MLMNMKILIIYARVFEYLSTTQVINFLLLDYFLFTVANFQAC